MKTKFVKDLEHGDRVALEGGVGIITRCKRSGIIEAAPGLGGAYEVEWKEEKSSDTGRYIASGLDQVGLAE